MGRQQKTTVQRESKEQRVNFVSDDQETYFREREEDSQAPPDLEPVEVQQGFQLGGDMGQFGNEGYEPSADELIDVLKNLENLAAGNPSLYRSIVDQIKGSTQQSFEQTQQYQETSQYNGNSQQYEQEMYEQQMHQQQQQEAELYQMQLEQQQMQMEMQQQMQQQMYEEQMSKQTTIAQETSSSKQQISQQQQMSQQQAFSQQQQVEEQMAKMNMSEEEFKQHQ